MKEIWKDIKDYEGLYQISNLGRVKSIIQWNGTNDRILTNMLDKDNYEYVKLSRCGKKKHCRVHRLVGLAFIPNPDNKPCINHKDGDKNNNNIKNIEWVTISENNNHAYETGLKNNEHLFGELNHFAILTEDDVLEIREKYIPRVYSTYMLAEEYNVSPGTISHIVNRKTWKHI